MSVRFLALITILAAAVTTNAADKRNITEKDLFDFVWVGDAQVSPDGARVAFVRVSVNEKKEGYNTSIWMVSTAGNEAPHRLTTGERDSSPRWSPDGKYLVFTRSTEKDGKPEPPQLCMLSMAGGDAFSFTSLPKGAGDPKWSPDGKLIVFTSSSNPEDLEKQEKKKRKEEEQKRAANATPSASPAKDQKPAEADERESDVHVVTRAVYRSNDEGYLDFKRPQHFWVVTAPRNADEKVQPKQLTRGRFDEDGAVWSKDGSQIYFATLHNDEPYYDTQKSELYSIAATGGEPVKLTTIDMDIGAMALSPDGKQVAFTGSVEQPVNSYTQPDLWVLDLVKDAKPRNLTEKFDWDVGSSVFGDNGAPRAGGGNPTDLDRGRQRDRRKFRAPGPNQSRALRRRDRRDDRDHEGRPGRAAFPRGAGRVEAGVSRFDADADRRFVLARSHQRRSAPVDPQQRRIVRPAQPDRAGRNPLQELRWKMVQAWLQKPPGFDPAKKYPLILNIHGGPHAAYGFIFEHEFQWMAAKVTSCSIRTRAAARATARNSC